MSVLAVTCHMVFLEFLIVGKRKTLKDEGLEPVTSVAHREDQAGAWLP